MWYSELISSDLSSICRNIGLIGTGFYMYGFFLVTTGRLNSAEAKYFFINLIASACMVVSLTVDFNASSMICEMFFVIASSAALIQRGRLSRKASKSRQNQKETAPTNTQLMAA